MFSWLVFITKVYTCIVYTPHVILTSNHFQRKVLSPEILFTWTASQMLTVFGQVDSCSYNEKKIQLILITFNILLSSRMYKHLIITFYYDILMLMFIISALLIGDWTFGRGNLNCHFVYILITKITMHCNACYTAKWEL